MMESVLKIIGCFVTVKYFDFVQDGKLLLAHVCCISSAMLSAFFCPARMGMLARIILTGSVYKKLMRLSITNESATGQIVNMISNDEQKIEDYFVFRHFILIFCHRDSHYFNCGVGLMTESLALALILFCFLVFIQSRFVWTHIFPNNYPVKVPNPAGTFLMSPRQEAHGPPCLNSFTHTRRNTRKHTLIISGSLRRFFCFREIFIEIASSWLLDLLLIRYEYRFHTCPFYSTLLQFTRTFVVCKNHRIQIDSGQLIMDFLPSS